VIGPPADDDPGAALKLLRRWLRHEQNDPDWARWVTLKNTPERLAKWLAERERQKERDKPYGIGMAS